MSLKAKENQDLLAVSRSLGESLVWLFPQRLRRDPTLSVPLPSLPGTGYAICYTSLGKQWTC